MELNLFDDFNHQYFLDLDEYLEIEKPTCGDISMSTSGTLKSDDGVSTDNGNLNIIAVENGVKLGHNVESELKEKSSENISTSIDIANLHPSQYSQLGRKNEPSEQEIRRMINRATQRCTNCGHYVPYNIDIEKHINRCMKKKESLKILTCDRCFIRTHSRKIAHGKYMCKICEKTLSYRDMIIDLKIHNNFPVNFLCTICCRKFINGSTVRERVSYEPRHYEVKEKEKEIPVFTCDICDRNFSQQTFLTDHKKTHYDKKDFMCGFCCQIFDTFVKLKEHLETHPHEKPSEKFITGRRWPKFSDNIIAPWLQ